LISIQSSLKAYSCRAIWKSQQQHCKKLKRKTPKKLLINTINQYCYLGHLEKASFIMGMDPDLQALDANPDPPKCCRSDRIRIHNIKKKRCENIVNTYLIAVLRIRDVYP
jgi:hypothetical protein